MSNNPEAPRKLAFLHTSHVLIPLFTQLAKEHLPGIETFHMTDESLIRNTIAAGRLTPNTIRRVAAMIGLAHDGGADAVMVTCSSIGHATALARSQYDFPVLRIDEALADTAVAAGTRIGVAATRGRYETSRRTAAGRAAGFARPRGCDRSGAGLNGACGGSAAGKQRTANAFQPRHGHAPRRGRAWIDDGLRA